MNWLLRCVTQPMSLHDLLWCFVAALSPAPFDKNEEEGEDEPEKKEHDVVCTLPDFLISTIQAFHKRASWSWLPHVKYFNLCHY